MKWEAENTNVGPAAGTETWVVVGTIAVLTVECATLGEFSGRGGGEAGEGESDDSGEEHR